MSETPDPLAALIAAALMAAKSVPVVKPPNGAGVVQWMEPVLLSDDLPSLLFNQTRLDWTPTFIAPVAHLVGPLETVELYRADTNGNRCQMATSRRTVCRALLNRDGSCNARKYHSSRGPLARLKMRREDAVFMVPDDSTRVRAAVPVAISTNTGNRENVGPVRTPFGSMLTNKIDYTDAADCACYEHRVAGQFWCAVCAS